MSKSMFANHKTVLGFAGVTIVIAIIAAVFAGSLVPSPEPEVVEVAKPEEPEKAATAAPAAPTWADEGDDGGFGDDWTDSAVASATPDESWGAQTGDSSSSAPDFGEYAPSTQSQSGGSNAGSASRSSGSSSGPTIRSGASPNAPPLESPGGPTVPLQRAD